MNQGDGEDAIVRLIQSYHELNTSIIDELAHLPSPMQFLRYVASNRPFVVRKGASSWPAVTNWDEEYLRSSLTDAKVRVAVTPRGNADAVVEDAHGKLMFVEPYEVYEPFGKFLDYIQEDRISDQNRPVRYAQPQNDSLRDEYRSLLKDVPATIDFASEALDKDVDAVNFWLGNARSTTSLHKDNYENIYVQIRGQKHFTLLSPVEQPCVNEMPLPFARYRSPDGNETTLEPFLNVDGEPIPVPLWDPDVPDILATAYSRYSNPIKVTLNEGDMMYLPAMWFHKVRQGNGSEGFSCSVNYWYDMEFGGSFWVTNAFVRDVYNSQAEYARK